MTNPQLTEEGPGPDFSGLISVEAFQIPATDLASPWIEHTPFALWLVQATRPRLFVELGTHDGISYFTCCGALMGLDTATRSFAVDTWTGDEHAGFYGNEVWERVSAINDNHYSSFSTLLRHTFDEALNKFEDGSIDLLHIDGRHFYEDVRHDFESWLPKMSRTGVVFLHDTNVHERNFGVARFWKELVGKYPHFEFLHGHGLGILAVGSEIPPGLIHFFESADDAATASAIRAAYSRLGAGIGDRLALQKMHGAHSALRSELSARTAQTEQRVEKARLEVDLAVASAKIASLKADAAQSRANLVWSENAELHQKIAQDQRIIQAMRERISRDEAERDFLEARCEQLTASTSWRLTSPFRTASRLARHPIRALRLLGASVRTNPTATWRKARRFLRERRAIRTLRHSKLFDASWYLEANPDVAAAGLDPLRHFVRCGAAEGRRPHPLFHTSWYLDTNPDVARSGVNPLLHFLQYGAAEGRDPNPDFDCDWYLAQNPDVACAGVNPLLHYHQDGALEGRLPSARFDPTLDMRLRSGLKVLANLALDTRPGPLKT